MFLCVTATKVVWSKTTKNSESDEKKGKRGVMDVMYLTSGFLNGFKALG